MRVVVVMALVLAACAPELRDDWYACDPAVADSCPEGFRCIAGRCRSGGGEIDAGPSPVDGGSDAGDAAVGCEPTCGEDDGNPCTMGCDAECNPLPRPDGSVCGGGFCCGAVCIFDADQNPLACGASCARCAETEACAAGSCECAAGLTDCGGGCVNTDQDPSHCGACGNVCAGTPCNGGECAACGSAADCDDGLGCTEDACETDGTCTHLLVFDFCLIGGVCIPDGTDGSNPCLGCIPSVSQTTWSPRTMAACDDGNACTRGDTCSATGSCQPGLPMLCPQCSACDSTTGSCAPQTGAPCTHSGVPCAMARCEAGTCVPERSCGTDGLSLVATPGANCAGNACRPCGMRSQQCCVDYSAIFSSGGTSSRRNPCSSGEFSCPPIGTCL
jgi:hypothetical protein